MEIRWSSGNGPATVVNVDHRVDIVMHANRYAGHREQGWLYLKNG